VAVATKKSISGCCRYETVLLVDCETVTNTLTYAHRQQSNKCSTEWWNTATYTWIPALH